MSWRRLIVILFWIVVAGLLARSMYFTTVRNLHTSTSLLGGPLHPVAKLPRPKSLKGPSLEVTNPSIEPIDRYHFNVHYRLTNNGDQTAKNIFVHIKPWETAVTPGSTELHDQRVDPSLPIVNEGKDDLIESLKPGESVDRSLNFNGVDYAKPSDDIFPSSFQVRFEKEEAAATEPKK